MKTLDEELIKDQGGKRGQQFNLVHILLFFGNRMTFGKSSDILIIYDNDKMMIFFSFAYFSSFLGNWYAEKDKTIIISGWCVFKYIDVEEISLFIYMDIDNVRDQLKRSHTLTDSTNIHAFWIIIVNFKIKDRNNWGGKLESLVFQCFWHVVVVCYDSNSSFCFTFWGIGQRKKKGTTEERRRKKKTMSSC